MFRRLSDAWGIGTALFAEAFLAHDQGDHARAGALYEEGLEQFRAAGDTWFIAMSLIALGWVTLDRGDPGRADALFAEAFALFRVLRDKGGMASGLEGLAAVAAARGHARRAARLWGAAEALHDSIGAPAFAFGPAGYQARLAAARAQLGDAVWARSTRPGVPSPWIGSPWSPLACRSSTCTPRSGSLTHACTEQLTEMAAA